jgi:uncharacterized OsmC-like protein
MRDTEAIAKMKTALERNMKALEQRPAIGRGTAVTRVKIRDACTAEIEDGGWKLFADEPVKDGGNGKGPDPGVFGRAALGSCLAMGYAQWASVLGVPLESIEVEVHADYDGNAIFGIDKTNPPGWGAVRYVVRIESSAPESEIQRVLDHADALSPLLDDFARALDVKREVQITTPASSS